MRKIFLGIDYGDKRVGLALAEDRGPALPFKVIENTKNLIQDIEERKNPSWPLTSFVHNMLSGPIRNDFEGVFCLDVLEHISKDSEDIF